MTRDQDRFGADHQYNRKQAATEAAAFESLRTPFVDGMMVEVMARGLPQIPVTLREAMIRPHIKELGKMLWAEGIVFAHLQDARLNERERKFMAAIATKLNGRRVIV